MVDMERRVDGVVDDVLRLELRLSWRLGFRFVWKERDLVLLLFRFSRALRGGCCLAHEALLLAGRERLRVKGTMRLAVTLWVSWPAGGACGSV